MHRIRFSAAPRGWWIACCVTAVSLTACDRAKPQPTSAPAASARPQAKPPNVILISIDSLRADHLGCYGYERETSPAIDELAADGVVFETMTSSSSWTLAGHATMFTGLPGSVHGCNHYTRRLVPSRTTLAEMFKAADYETAGFWSGPFLHPVYGLDQGLDRYINCSQPKAYEAFHEKEETPAEGTPTWKEVGEAHKMAHRDITSPRILEEVTQWFKSPHDRPYFLFIHMWDVHFDYIPPAPYDTMFDPDYHGRVDGRNYRKNPQFRDNLSKRDLKHVISLYDGEIRWTDEHIGKLFTLLKERGEFDSAVIAVTADHGEAFNEHGEMGHYWSLYDEETHIPLVVRYPPRLAGGSRVSVQAGMVDIAPTLLDLAGVSAPHALFGESLTRWVDSSQNAEDRIALSELVTRELAADETQVAIRTREWKYLVEREQDKPTGLWNLIDDPGEQHNLLESDPKLAATAAHEYAVIAARLRALQETHPMLETERDDALPDETLQQLKALGYIGGDDDAEDDDD